MKLITVVANFLRYLLPEDKYMSFRALYERFRGMYHDGTKVDLVDWNLYLEDPRMDRRLADMLKVFIDHYEKTMTSTYWSVLCRKNVAQFLEMKYENFKQTVALNYFTWIVGQEDPQSLFLQSYRPEEALALARKRATSSGQHAFMTKEQLAFYNLMTYVLWMYTEGITGRDLLANLEEPAEENLSSVRLDDRAISQDLANLVLEYHSVYLPFQNYSEVADKFQQAQSALPIFFWRLIVCTRWVRSR